jgi:hypothetical protein
VTDSNDPTRRRRPHREPAILDLKPTVVDDGRTPPAPAAGAGDDGRTSSEAAAPAAGEGAASAPTNDLDAEPAAGTDANAVHGAAWPDASAVASEGSSTAPGSVPGAAGHDAAGSVPGIAAHDAPGSATGTLNADADRSVERDTVEPTVPVADADFTPPPAGSVPPVAAAASRDEAPRRGAGFGSLLTAGVLGGLIGAGALYGLQSLRPAQPVVDPRIAEIQQRLAALPRTDAGPGLERRIAAIETAQTDIGQRLGAAQSLAERAAARAEEAANRPAPAPGTPAPGTSAPGTSAPGTPAPATPAPAAAGAPAANPAALNDLTGRLAALEGQVRNPPPAVAELTNRLGTLERQIGERVQANTTATQTLERRLAETAGATQGLEGRLAEAATARQGLEQRLEQRLGQNDQRIADLQRQLAQWSPQAVQAGLRTVLAGRLNDALAQGAPYADILNGLRRFEADPARVQALEPLAASGAPTAAALQQEFRPLAERIVRDTRGEADTIAERILRMADRVVTVRAVDDPASNAVPAVVARIENALSRGALGDAAAAWDSLPEGARQASAAWGGRLKARVAAEQAARAIASDSVAALNAAPR